jgi:hypothetical protein
MDVIAALVGGIVGGSIGSALVLWWHRRHPEDFDQ